MAWMNMVNVLTFGEYSDNPAGRLQGLRLSVCSLSVNRLLCCFSMLN